MMVRVILETNNSVTEWRGHHASPEVSHGYGSTKMGANSCIWHASMAAASLPQTNQKQSVFSVKLHQRMWELRFVHFARECSKRMCLRKGYSLHSTRTGTGKTRWSRNHVDPVESGRVWTPAHVSWLWYDRIIASVMCGEISNFPHQWRYRVERS
jgi:hypothetical protein